MIKSFKLLSRSAVFAAMIAALTFFVKIPVGNGYIHIGDSVIYIAACVLPAPYAMAAAGIGGALSDALGGYAAYIIPTFIIKALITLPYTSKKNTVLIKRNVFMVIPAGVISVGGYFAAAWFLYGGAGAAAGLPGDIIQAAGSAALFFVFALMLDKVNFKQNLRSF